MQRLPVLAIATLLWTSLANAAEPPAALDKGKELHQKNCIACHTSLTGGKPDALYTRADRRVNSLDALQKQVQRCELNLGLTWFDEDIDAVASYLNQEFYHFK